MRCIQGHKKRDNKIVGRYVGRNVEGINYRARGFSAGDISGNVEKLKRRNRRWFTVHEGREEFFFVLFDLKKITSREFVQECRVVVAPHGIYKVIKTTSHSLTPIPNHTKSYVYLPTLTYSFTTPPTHSYDSRTPNRRAYTHTYGDTKHKECPFMCTPTYTHTNKQTHTRTNTYQGTTPPPLPPPHIYPQKYLDPHIMQLLLIHHCLECGYSRSYYSINTSKCACQQISGSVNVHIIASSYKT